MKLKSNFACFKAGLLLLLFCIPTSSSAQITSASNPDIAMDIHDYSYPCSTDVLTPYVETLNCDMLTVSPYKLWALAYTLADGLMKDPATGCTLYTNIDIIYSGVTVRYTDPNTAVGFPVMQRDLWLPNALNPDIVLGNGSSAGDYLLGVVYNHMNGTDVEIATAPMTNVGTGIAALGSLGSAVKLNDGSNGRIARDPHIDMIGNVANAIGGGHTLERFVATWTEHDPNNSIDYIMLATGDLSNPAVFTRTQITPNNVGDPTGILPDVAASGNWGGCGANCSDRVFITYVDPANSDALMHTTVSVSPSTGVVSGISHLTLSSAHSRIEAPRIEAIGLGYNPVFGEIDWQVVASIDNGGGSYDVYAYNNVGGITVNSNVCQVNSGDDHFSPVVAGVGEDMDAIGTGKVGETSFSVAYYSTYTHTTGAATNGDIFMNSIGIYTGSMSSTYYEVNSADLAQASAYTSPVGMQLAITSSSNTGDDLLTFWNRGDGTIRYKFSGNGYSFKTTGIVNINGSDYNVYPNPATDMVHIDNANNTAYSITDVMGRLVSSGTVNKDEYVLHIDSLIPGIYILQLGNNNTVQEKIKIVKQ